MAKILGLDLGTNSIGWAVVEYERAYISENGMRKVIERFSPPFNKGVYIFTEGVDKDSYGNPQSRAASRTDKRSARRLKFRRKLRKYETLKALIKYGMCPLTMEELEKWRQYVYPKTNKKESFRHYPTNPKFLKWLQTDNQGEKDDAKDKQLRKKKIKNPYYFRDKASREKITDLHELGRALYHLAQRRGFLSNRLDKSDKTTIEKARPELLNIVSESSNYTELYLSLNKYFEEKDSGENTDNDKTLKNLWKRFDREFKKLNKNYTECRKYVEEFLSKPENLGPVQKRIFELTQEMNDPKNNCKTLGQLFYKWNLSNIKIRSNYTGREEHYEQEFKEICRVQGIKEDSQQYKDLHNGIFYQRKLKSQKGLVGKCTLEPKYPRCPVSHPSFEEFRLLKFLNNIKIKEGKEWRMLNDEEKKKTWDKFFRKSKEHFEFKELAKLISSDYPWDGKSDEEPDEKKQRFNYKGNATVMGCYTIANMMDLFGKDWKQEDWKNRDWHDILKNPIWKSRLYEQCKKNTIKDRKTKEIKGQKDIETVVNDIWHALFIFDKEANLKDFAKNYFTDDDKTAERFSKIQLKQEYASFSLKSISNIIPFLREGLIESYAIFLAKIPEIIAEKWKNKEDQQLIREGLWNILETYRENKRKQIIVNELFKKFRDEYANNDGTYTLDKKDKENALNKLQNSYGEKTWREKSIEEKNKIIIEVEELFQKQLRKNAFIKIKRLDEEIKDFFIAHPDLGIDAEKAEKIYHPSDIEKFKVPVKKTDDDGKEREYPNTPISGSIKNPTVFRALFQLRKVLNELIRRDVINRETRVHIELARELNDMNYRKAVEDWQKEREKENEEYKQIIIGLFKAENKIDLKETEDEDLKRIRSWHDQYKLEHDRDLFALLPKDEKDPVKKYRLWEEQKGRCVYTGNQIPLNKLFDGVSFDIEHTIPKSKSNDNSLKNLTVCDAKYNRQNKKGKIPFDLGKEKLNEILNRIEPWRKYYLELDKQIKAKEKAAAATKDDKERHNKIIQQKHKLTFEKNYWHEKYHRFTMEEIPDSFTNRHLVDTGIITRYAQQWLKKYFSEAPVFSVNGEIVYDFRTIWGLQKEYTKKERVNHIHHCIDAITIACITKDKYDLLAHAYRTEEEGMVNEAKKILENSKPWTNFTSDVLKIEDEVSTVHQFQDNLPRQSKKYVRVRGKRQYIVEYEKDKNGNILRDVKGKRIVKKDENGKIIYKLKDGKRIPKVQQGDTVRAILHKETFYGAIKKAIRDKDGKIKRDKEGNMLFEKNKHGKEEFYVLRKELEKLKKTDVEKIVDEEIKKIIKKAVIDKIITFNNSGAVIKKIEGKEVTIWQNEAKQIPIKKVRVEVKLQNPLPEFKKHRDTSKPSHKHKEWYYVDNAENYCLAIYEGQNEKGEIERTTELAKNLVNNIDAGKYYRLSNKKSKDISDLAPIKDAKAGYPLKVILKKDQMILRKLEGETIDDILALPVNKQLDRLFVIIGLDKDGIKCYYHNEARPSGDVLDAMNSLINSRKKEKKKNGEEKESKLSSGKGGTQIGEHKDFPFIKFKPGNFEAFVEGIDFKISATGKIERFATKYKTEKIIENKKDIEIKSSQIGENPSGIQPSV